MYCLGYCRLNLFRSRNTRGPVLPHKSHGVALASSSSSPAEPSGTPEVNTVQLRHGELSHGNGLLLLQYVRGNLMRELQLCFGSSDGWREGKLH